MEGRLTSSGSQGVVPSKYQAPTQLGSESEMGNFMTGGSQTYVTLWFFFLKIPIGWVLICSCHFRRIWPRTDSEVQCHQAALKKTLRTGPNHLLWHWSSVPVILWNSPVLFVFLLGGKEPRAEGYQNKPNTGDPFHFPFPLLFLCSLFSLQWKFGRVLWLPTSFLLFLFFHKVKDWGGTPNRFFSSSFFSNLVIWKNWKKIPKI